MLSLLFALLAQPHAQRPPQTLFVSPSDNQALVLASPDGQLRLLKCRLPQSFTYDFSFTGAGALDHCRGISGGIADTPRHRALLAQELDALLRERIQKGRTPDQRLRRIGLTAALLAPVLTTGYVVVPVVLKRMGRSSTLAHVSLGQLLSQIGIGTVLGSTIVLASEAIDQIEISMLAEVATRRETTTGPILLRSQIKIFGLLTSYVGQAFQRVSVLSQQN